jgi:hypothetical protein
MFSNRLCESFGNNVPRKIFVPKREKVAEGRKKCAY